MDLLTLREFILSDLRFKIKPIHLFIAGTFALMLIFGFFFTYYKIPYTSTGLYFEFATKFMNGLVPYRDFPVEYPPLSLVFFILPRLIASTYPEYKDYFRFSVFLTALTGLYIYCRISDKDNKNNESVLFSGKMMLVYILSILAVGPIVSEQYDIFSAIMTLISVYFYMKNRHTAAWMFLGLATACKLYPIVIAPIYIIDSVSRKKPEEIVWGAFVYVLTGILCCLPLFLKDPVRFFDFLIYHSDRGIQIESIYSSFILMAHSFGLTLVEAAFDFGSWNITGYIPRIVIQFITPFTIFLFALLYMTYFYIAAGSNIKYVLKDFMDSLKKSPKRVEKMTQSVDNKSNSIQAQRVACGSLAAILLFICAGKVFSPQYIIWAAVLVPFFIYLKKYHSLPLIILFLIIAVLTHLIFPVNYKALLSFEKVPIYLLFIRNSLLLIMTGAFIFAMKSRFCRKHEKT